MTRTRRMLIPVALSVFALPAAAGERAAAVTFDDLPAPAASIVSNQVAEVRQNTIRLLAAVAAHRIPTR